MMSMRIGNQLNETAKLQFYNEHLRTFLKHINPESINISINPVLNRFFTGHILRKFWEVNMDIIGFQTLAPY